MPANPPDAGTLVAVEFGQDWIPALLTVLEIMRQDGFFASAPSDIQEQIDELDNRIQNTMIISPQAYPAEIFHFHCNSFVVTGAAITYINQTVAEFNGYWAQSVAVQDDAWKFPAALKAGTYTVSVRGQKFSGAGKIDLAVDGVNNVLLDLYSATTQNNQVVTASIVVPTDGEHVFDVIIHAKNASSTGYACRINMISLIRQ